VSRQLWPADGTARALGGFRNELPTPQLIGLLCSLIKVNRPAMLWAVISGFGTDYPSGDIRFHGESWRVTGPSSDIGVLALIGDFWPPLRA
jgi:hypothetical protein